MINSQNWSCYMEDENGAATDPEATDEKEERTEMSGSVTGT